MTYPERKRFTMGGGSGPRCVHCGELLRDVYRTEHKDVYTLRKHICPNPLCGKRTTTIQKAVGGD